MSRRKQISFIAPFLATLMLLAFVTDVEAPGRAGGRPDTADTERPFTVAPMSS
jgi:hypothetical protein